MVFMGDCLRQSLVYEITSQSSGDVFAIRLMDWTGGIRANLIFFFFFFFVFSIECDRT